MDDEIAEIGTTSPGDPAPLAPEVDQAARDLEFGPFYTGDMPKVHHRRLGAPIGAGR